MRLKQKNFVKDNKKVAIDLSKDNEYLVLQLRKNLLWLWKYFDDFYIY